MFLSRPLHQCLHSLFIPMLHPLCMLWKNNTAVAYLECTIGSRRTNLVLISWLYWWAIVCLYAFSGLAHHTSSFNFHFFQGIWVFHYDFLDIQSVQPIVVMVFILILVTEWLLCLEYWWCATCNYVLTGLWFEFVDSDFSCNVIVAVLLECFLDAFMVSLQL